MPSDLIMATMGVEGIEYYDDPQNLRRWERSQAVRGMTNMHNVPTDDLSQMHGGRSGKPTAPIVLVDGGGNQVFIVGMGYTENAELEDLVAAQREAKPINFEEQRARAGLPSLEDAGRLMGEAIERWADYQKKNSVTGMAWSDPDLKGYE